MRHKRIVTGVAVAGLVLALTLQGRVSGQQQPGYVLEPAKRIPIVYDADVVVAGAGVAGVYAALAAARHGATTVLVERYSSVAGTSGPGLNPRAGSQPVGIIEPARNAHVYPEIAGLPKEFTLRVARYKKEHGIGQTRLDDSHGINYHATRMLLEAGVKILVSTWATDPIMDGNLVRGLFIENKSGRGAVTAKVVVDATGEADVARRAGAPIIQPKNEYRAVDTHAPNGIGLWAYVGGIDWDKYRAALKSKGNKFEGEFPPYAVPGLPAKIIVSKASADGTLFNQKHADPVTGLKVQVVRPHGNVDAGNGVHMAALETAYRLYVYEVVQDIRKRVPGCENLYLVAMGEMGVRGGPNVEAEHVLTMDDAKVGRRFDDVMYVYGEKRALEYSCDVTKQCAFVDVPYRVMVPKKIDGLLAVGRSASSIPDTLLRNRTAVQHMGEAGGTAAALAAKSGVTPRRLDVKAFQKELLAAGYYLGDAQRLKALALAN
jgi:ribulose 1,5-bisphosphate synthetase/thiazole synthase